MAPIAFESVEYIRIGSSTTKLHGHYEKQRQLWHNFTRTSFEHGVALSDVPHQKDVLRMLRYESYFKLLDQPIPSSGDAIIARLEEEKFVRRNPSGGYDITNLGAIAFARNLGALGLERKAVRLVVYSGESRHEEAKEKFTGTMGYAAGFEGLLEYLNALLPSSDAIGVALRKNVPLYPPLAVRELVANALVHQDFSLTGTGPVIELFSDRLEITNPGRPLIDPLRFLDAPPRSRNEKLAGLLRRLGMCEELGTGIDKVVRQAEVFQLPPPDFRVNEEHMTAVLYAPRPFAHMDRSERVRATYQHACLKWLAHSHLTNASLRERFGISAANSAIASRIIGETIDAGRIVADDPDNRSRKHARYVPFWAKGN
jgi:ATP-dependent DNA helicase RecG